MQDEKTAVSAVSPGKRQGPAKGPANQAKEKGPEDRKVVLDVRNLQTALYRRKETTYAVDHISFTLREGETLGIVGESGSGKTMLSRSLMTLPPEPVAEIVGGEILLDGEDILKLSKKDRRLIRGSKIAIILQDPQTALNPVFSIGNQLIEVIKSRAGKSLSKEELNFRAVMILRRMGVAAPERRVDDFPHQLSGGMKQRVVGGIAIESTPRVLIADEPTTALDVTIQAQYLRLLKEIQEDTGVSIIFITHDLGIVAQICDRVAVMYAGRIVEQGTIREIFKSPSHPYTEALLKSVPRVERKVERLSAIEGQPPSLFNLPPGCYFEPRCPYAKDICRESYPPTFDEGETGHQAACWRLDKSWPNE
jgi:oligopeptide/dipeptide ABC transporter ATP-binding protein